jgi:peptidoglycan hydrolase-like protein with peptidoglycan-binding domain
VSVGVWSGGQGARRRRRTRLTAVVVGTVLVAAAGVAVLVTQALPWTAPWDVGATSAPDPGVTAVPDPAPARPGGVAADDDAADERVTTGPGDAEVVDSWAVSLAGTGPWRGHTDEPAPATTDAQTDADLAADEAATDDDAPADEGTDAAPEVDDRPALPSTREVQERLRELGYLLGAADGTLGQRTRTAVMAYQRVHGLQVDGIVGPQTAGSLAGPVIEPTLRGGPDDRIEVDLDRQLLHLVEGGVRTVTLKVSSGNGGTYRTGSGGTARSRTPVGEFTVLRRVHGVRVAPLGTLYDPLYYYGGFAIHGSDSVPPYPASHGCIRISRADAVWLIDRVPTGLPVHVYGGQHVFSP